MRSQEPGALDDVLEAASELRRASSDYVFPSKTGGRISGFSDNVDRPAREAGVERFGLHDARRTMRTVLARLGYSDQVGGAVVGQKAPEFDRRYNKHDGFFIRRIATKAHADFIASLVGGKRIDNVISFHRLHNPEAQLERQLDERLHELRAQALDNGD